MANSLEVRKCCCLHYLTYCTVVLTFYFLQGCIVDVCFSQLPEFVSLSTNLYNRTFLACFGLQKTLKWEQLIFAFFLLADWSRMVQVKQNASSLHTGKVLMKQSFSEVSRICLYTA